MFCHSYDLVSHKYYSMFLMYICCYMYEIQLCWLEFWLPFVSILILGSAHNFKETIYNEIKILVSVIFCLSFMLKLCFDPRGFMNHVIYLYLACVNAQAEGLGQHARWGLTANDRRESYWGLKRKQNEYSLTFGAFHHSLS